VPESGKRIEKTTQLAIDYTFWMNLVAVFSAGVLAYLHPLHIRKTQTGNKKMVIKAKRE